MRSQVTQSTVPTALTNGFKAEPMANGSGEVVHPLPERVREVSETAQPSLRDGSDGAQPDAARGDPPAVGSGGVEARAVDPAPGLAAPRPGRLLSLNSGLVSPSPQFLCWDWYKK